MTNQNSQSQQPLVSQEAQDLEEVQLEKVVGGGSFRNLWKCCTGGSPTTEGPIPPPSQSHPITTIPEAPEEGPSLQPARQPHTPTTSAGIVRTDSGNNLSVWEYRAFLHDPSRSLEPRKK